MDKLRLSRNLLFVLLANAMIFSQISAAQTSTDEIIQKITKKEYFLTKVANPELELKPCTEWTDCASCTKRLGTAQNGAVVRCRWCPAVDLCSTGDDANRREWLRKQCHMGGFVTKHTQCPLKTKAEIEREREYMYFCLVQSMIGWFFIFIAKSIQNHGIHNAVVVVGIIVAIAAYLGNPILVPGGEPAGMRQGPVRYVFAG